MKSISFKISFKNVFFVNILNIYQVSLSLSHLFLIINYLMIGHLVCLLFIIAYSVNIVNRHEFTIVRIS